MQISPFRRWWRVHSARAWCAAAIVANGLWACNIWFVGPVLLLPGFCSISVLCGMILVDQDPRSLSGKPVSVVAGEPAGLRIFFYDAMDCKLLSKGMAARAPWLPHYESSPHGPPAASIPGWSVGVPWFAVIPTFYGLAFFAWRRKRRRLRLRQCTVCGHDLSNLTSSRCPECGCIPALE